MHSQETVTVTLSNDLLEILVTTTDRSSLPPKVSIVILEGKAESELTLGFATTWLPPESREELERLQPMSASKTKAYRQVLPIFISSPLEISGQSKSQNQAG
jgi:hypothetical protein